MSLSRDTSLWYNLPGIVAAYQPVRAPGPLDARYNMRGGGVNSYRAEPGVLPTWTAPKGWTLDGSSQYLKPNLNIVPPGDQSWAVIVRFSSAATSGGRCVIGSYRGVDSGAAFGIWTDEVACYNGYGYPNGKIVNTPAMAGGTYAISGRTLYRNGKIEQNLIPTALAVGAIPEIYIGCRNDPASSGAGNYFSGDIQAIVILARRGSAGEIVAIMRQMAYCDTNPEWSVWARQRQWFYMPAGFRAAWATGINTQIGTGTGANG